MKLNIAFLWHLHQPYYVDPDENSFLLPWVRLHATKNYLFIAELFKKFPEIKQNVNLVPSLLRQIEHYDKDGMVDTYLLLSEKNAYELTSEEKEFILKNFFHAYAETLIFQFPRYRELYERRETTGGDIPRASKLFGVSEITDLQVLFNLAWLNPLHYEGHGKIRKIVEKGKLFTEDEKKTVLQFHREIIARVIGSFREIAKENITELTVSPFYHPILPLLIDSNCAKRADPSVQLPPFRLAFPEDAEHQIREGRDYFLDLFGYSPDGIWPSEGSVSDEAIEMMASQGFRYTFTDELILNKSIKDNFYRESDGLPDKPEVLYQPYRFKNTDFFIFFRDHYLSDLIGFVYKNWDPETAVHHLIDKFTAIRTKLIKRGYDPEDFIVSLIFDGENPWEYYQNYGIDFLNELFRSLRNNRELNVTTFNKYLLEREKRAFPVLDSVEPGSWIDGTFGIWFGHREDYAAWKCVYDLKMLLYNSNIESHKLSKALQYLRIAEGSDWYWWYGDEHFTANLIEFDNLFRKNIKKAYKEIDIEAPRELEKEIFSPERAVQVVGEKGLSLRVTSHITPLIDGKITSYFEWIGGANYSQTPVFGTMHRAGFGIIRNLYAGYDTNYFFLRIDFHKDTVSQNVYIGLKVNVNGKVFDFVIDTVNKYVKGEFEDTEERVVFAFHTIFEMSFPLNDLLVNDKGTIQFFALGTIEGVFEERWPESLEFRIDITGEDPAKEEWII